MRLGGLKYFLLFLAQAVLWNYFNFSQYVVIAFLPAMILCLPISRGTLEAMIIAFVTGVANAFRYAYCPLPELRGGDELTFTAECKVPSLTLPGVVHVGIYEFADPKAHKVVRFQLVRVEPGDDWQTVSKRVKLAPETQCARFYLIGRNLAQGETLLVRKATVEKH